LKVARRPRGEGPELNAVVIPREGVESASPSGASRADRRVIPREGVESFAMRFAELAIRIWKVIPREGVESLM